MKLLLESIVDALGAALMFAIGLGILYLLWLLLEWVA